MKSVNVDFHNDEMQKATITNLDSGDALAAVGEILDQWKELLARESATNVSIQMVYMDENKRVGIDDISVYTAQNNVGESRSFVDASGIVFETENPDETVELYVSLCDHTEVVVEDNCDEISGEMERIQQIVLQPDTDRASVIDVVCKK